MRRLHLAVVPPQKTLFYGWIVALGCLLVTVANGGLFWTFGVFFQPLHTEFGWSRGQLSLVSSAFFMVYAPGAILWGKIADRFGPRKVLWLASLLVFLGYLGSSRIHSWMPLVIYYALLGLGTSATLGLPVATVQRWFLKRRGLMLGVIASGPGIGSFIFAPMANKLIYSYDWRTAYILLGIILGLCLALGSYLMVHSPDKRGLIPYGEEKKKPAIAASRLRSDDGIRAGQALRTKAFWGLGILHILSLMPTLFFTTHLVPFVVDRGSTAAIAAQALGLLGICGVPGRVLLSGAADRIGWMKGLAISNFMSAAAISGLLFTTETWTLYLFVIAFGFFNGGNLSLLTGAVGLFFGMASLGELLGYNLAISVLAGSASPWLGGFAFDLTGSYFFFLLFAMTCYIGGGVYSLFLKPPKGKSS